MKFPPSVFFDIQTLIRTAKTKGPSVEAVVERKFAAAAETKDQLLQPAMSVTAADSILIDVENVVYAFNFERNVLISFKRNQRTALVFVNVEIYQRVVHEIMSNLNIY